MNFKSFITNVDSYKASHYLQYPEGTEKVYSYIESRGGKWNKTLFFGLQAFIKEYLQTPITMKDVVDAEEFFKAHGEPFNRAGWEIIVKEYGGILPIKIWAVPEGTMVPVGMPLVGVLNTDDRLAWVTSYVETALLRAIWYPTTVATQSKEIKNLILRYLEETGDPAGINFKLHDFGARGVSSFESAMIGGMSHLVNFMGTDTVSGIIAAQRWYGPENEMFAFSIPAAEHSTMTILGREGEEKQFKRMLDQFAKPGSLVAVVSDSFDIYNACKVWGTKFKQQIVDSGATIVIRPDSGDPVEVVTKVAQELDKYFGSVENDKGYKVLNNVRIIQGDGINYDSIKNILTSLKVEGFSADNIAFGMGGALLQQINRDTQKFAMKASAAQINGVWVNFRKDPVTDSGKRSKMGIQYPYKSRLTGEWMYSQLMKNDVADEWEPMFSEVYENGRLLKEYTFQEIRDNSNV